MNNNNQDKQYTQVDKVSSMFIADILFDVTPKHPNTYVISNIRII